MPNQTQRKAFNGGCFISTRRPVSRRKFLHGAGAILSLPFLESMLPGLAQAATPSTLSDNAATPRRMFAICNNLGLLGDQFFPQGSGRDYKLSPYLSHLSEHRDDFSVFSGVSHPNVDGAHPTQKCFLAAAPNPSTGSFRNTISLDQLVAEQIGTRTRFPSLTLSVNSRVAGLSWTAIRWGQAIPMGAGRILLVIA
jgi:hypothetical protein